MVDASHPNCRAVPRARAGVGVPGRVRCLAEPARSAAGAAEQLGVEVAAIANSLIFLADDDEPVLILASGAHRVDVTKAAAALGTGLLRRAQVEQVRAATGQPIGGVAPVAHPRPLRTLVDNDLAAYDTVWAAGGIPHAVFPTSFAELVRMTAGQSADVA